ncbi:MAG: hypothetical protein ACI808_002039 [Paraglaciecola sp.]|jgi:uncharacterized protein YggE
MKKHLLAIVLGTSTLMSAGAIAADVSFPHLETTGMGEVVAQPDMAVFSVEVTETRKTAKEAKQAVDKAVAAFTERLSKQGVERSDVESANITLRPEYHYQKDQKPELTGYRASRHITVTVKQLDNLNQYLDGALGDGINTINNIQLKVSNEAEFVELARQAAIQDAKAKANSLATGFGEEVDGVWKITYRTSPPRPMMMRTMAMDASSNVEASYQDTQIVIRDQVDVIFRLED